MNVSFLKERCKCIIEAERKAVWIKSRLPTYSYNSKGCVMLNITLWLYIKLSLLGNSTGKKMLLPTQPACNRATTLAGPEYQQNNMVLFIIFSLLVYRFKTQQICNINLKGFYVLDSLFMNNYVFALAWTKRFVI